MPIIVKRSLFVLLGLLVAAIAIALLAMSMNMPQTEVHKATVAPAPQKVFTMTPEEAAAAPEPAAKIACTGMKEAARICAPSLGVNAVLDTVGLTAEGNIHVPESSIAGWYNESSPIADPLGDKIVVGHVNFADNSPGVFGYLHQAAPGAHVYVSDGTGAVFAYRVNVVNEPIAQNLLSTIEMGTKTPARLRMITCSGASIQGGTQWQYEFNLIVDATLDTSPTAFDHMGL